MGTPPNDPELAISADIDRAEREMEELGRVAEKGARLGELLRKKVDLQRRIQQLRDEENVLQSKHLVKKLAKTKDLEATATAQQSEKYKKFISAKLPRRSAMKQKRFTCGGSPKKSITAPGGSRADVLAGTLRRSSPSLGQSPDRSRGADRRHTDGPGLLKQDELDSEGADGDDTAEEVEEDISFSQDGEGMGANFMQIVRAWRSRTPNVEEQAEAERRAREGRMQQTASRQQASLRRFNLVEEMFAKAVERRMRAMRRIAADPPADRLIGNCALQHIPVGLLPGELQETAMALMEGTLQGTSGPVGGAVATIAYAETPKKNFFLTGVDATTAEKSGEGQGKESGTAQEEQHPEDGEARTDDGNDGSEEFDEGELARQWRELGYTAVYLPASKRLVFPGAKDNGGRGGRRPYDPNTWMKLQPLPSVHLVQRRVPVEDLLRRDVTIPTKGEVLLPTLRAGKR
ncbi:hypothetical protein DQ04_00261210 [Trypanosoma grayi]|uniref:hypothetical protein n=1 Tax=Trypanosoma grayi TaxID=71804 RepID=UPI0004F40471|nr:hypothetical protein DQ04_00261210 [Trypanosoma grayi]KEG14922.1 hypothetical protein DQ04_00261210 [Trypanosoma grayi]